MKHLAAFYFPDLTYTGRTTLWEFAGEMLAWRPWTGYGFESFWGTPLLLNQDQPFDRAWDIRTIVHGHNGYLDIAVLMGIPALCVAVYTFLIAPLRDYMRIPLRKENVYLGDFFMMVVLFAALNAFLEASSSIAPIRSGCSSCSACSASGKCRCGRSRFVVRPDPSVPRGLSRLVASGYGTSSFCLSIGFSQNRYPLWVRCSAEAPMTIKLVLAGCGNMGYAMLSGWLKSGKLPPAAVFVVEPNPDFRKRAEALGCNAAAEAGGIPADAVPALVVIAVKPQVIRDVTAAYRRFNDGRTTFVSIAAGTPVATFEAILGDRTPVVRCMPNTPAAIGKGMMVVFSNRLVSIDTKRFVADLLSASGEVTDIDDEGLMDAVTAVSGSGPAYIFHFIEALTVAAEKAGLPAKTARLLAMQTVYGAASLAAESGEDPGVLRQQVTSPNGTTAAALAVLMGEDRLTKLLTEAVEAARLRSIELGK